MEETIRMNWQCPVPAGETDMITLGHGSGGLLSNQLLDTGIFSLFGNEILDQRHDGALFSLSGRVAMSTDTFVVSPVFFPGGNIGDLAVNGTVNDLAMCGARPKYLSIGFVLEEGLPMYEFREILQTIKKASDACGVLIVTGDTKVVERGKGDKIFINSTGIGETHQRAQIATANIRPGDRIIVSGPLARHGIAVMSVREGLEFETNIVSDTRPLHNIVWKLLDEFGEKIRLLKDPTRGGLATVLNEIARDAHCGIEILQKDIPIEEQVSGACELLGLDPLYVACEGVFVAVVAEEIAEDFLAKMKTWEHGSGASLIGEVGREHAGKVLMRSSIGGRRVLGMLAGEQLPRIC